MSQRASHAGAITASTLGGTARIDVTTATSGIGVPEDTSAGRDQPEPAPVEPAPPPRRPACNHTVSGSAVAGALSSASAGSAVCLSAGSYGTLTLDNINPAGNVTLEPAEGAAVEIEGINMASDSNLTVSGFELHAGIDVREADSNLVFSENLTRESECGYFLYGEGSSGISQRADPR